MDPAVRSDLFFGVVFYCHWSGESECKRIASTIKALGGRGARIDAESLTHIVVFPPNPRRDAIFPTDPHHRYPTSYADFELKDIVQNYARGSHDTQRPPIVVDSHWVDACIAAHRVLAQEDNWGGWAIRRSRDPRLVNAQYRFSLPQDHGWHKPLPSPPSAIPPAPPTEPPPSPPRAYVPRVPPPAFVHAVEQLAEPFDVGARAELGSIAAAQTEPLRIRGVSAQRSRSCDPRRREIDDAHRRQDDAARSGSPRPRTAACTEGKRPRVPASPSKSAAAIKTEACSPARPAKRTRPRSPTCDRHAEPSVTADFLNADADASTPPATATAFTTPLPSVPATLAAHATPPLFAVGLVSLWFAVEGPEYFQNPMDKLIKSHGGTLQPRSSAQLIVLPLEPGQAAFPPELELAVRDPQRRPQSRLLSYKWVVDSVDAGALADMTAYVIQERAPWPTPPPSSVSLV